ncbi:DUF4123 domain-containing protein [Massilia forsythiae]|uniref:DUF4123 domain-containing protein n=1 Tax=Massilia forsythiae TaxID=2728020 RepID=A0A7Z2ZTP0_9BURK|nr:DUF4123 domain-containing protein [Massilia forsythiae]QJE01796.1 DUF4123 domain-containing protein [Massilia forsythiae]
MNGSAQQSFRRLLWRDAADGDGQHVHWILDGARDRAIVPLVRTSGLEHVCMFSGPLHPRLEAAAPYLVRLPASSEAACELLRRGWGRSWGILITADAALTLDQLRLHLKKFLRVKTEDGRTLAFRYYDPRVLNIFIPTCTNAEFKTFLGPVTRLLAETNGGAAAREFDLEDDILRVRDHADIALGPG